MSWLRCPFIGRSAELVFEWFLKPLKIIDEDIAQAEESMQGHAFVEIRFGLSTDLSVEDAQKLDDVREALRRGDLKAAGKLARVFRLTPIN